jgi:hypothetical protein
MWRWSMDHIGWIFPFIECGIDIAFSLTVSREILTLKGKRHEVAPRFFLSQISFIWAPGSESKMILIAFCEFADIRKRTGIGAV